MKVGEEAAILVPTRRSPARRILGAGLTLAASIYITIYVVNQWPVLASAIEKIKPANTAIAIAMITLMVALKATYHVIALRRLSNDQGPSATKIALAYAVSQIVRYLPGKILGVVYEANQLAGAISTQQIVTANLVQMLLTSALTVAVLAAVAAWVILESVWSASALLAISLIALWLGHRLHLAERFITTVARFLPRLRNLPHIQPSTKHWALAGSLILLAEWLPYFGYWTFLLPGGTNGVREAILLGSCYAGASIAANLAFIMPSGLVIREALFLWIGSQLAMDPPTLIVLGVLSRLLFTLADLALIPFVWLLGQLSDLCKK